MLVLNETITLPCQCGRICAAVSSAAYNAILIVVDAVEIIVTVTTSVTATQDCFGYDETTSGCWASNVYS